LVLFSRLTGCPCGCRFQDVSQRENLDEEDVKMAEENKKAPEAEEEEEEEYCDPAFVVAYEAALAQAKEEAAKEGGLKPSIKRKCRGIDEWEYWQSNRKHRVGNPAIISPNYVEFWVNGRYHKDGGPSCIYRDGEKLFHLNGVLMPEAVVMADDKDFDKDWFLKNENVEQRREVLRTFGVERVLSDLKATVLDKKDDYELLMIELGNGVEPCPALKMKNPSEGTWHVEWVNRSCRTVDAALEFRNQSTLKPSKLT